MKPTPAALGFHRPPCKCTAHTFPRKLSDIPFNRYNPILLAQALSERAINSTVLILLYIYVR